MMRRVTAVLLALLVLCTLVPALASAHAELVSSNPEAGALLAEAPPTVRLSFSEPIEPDFFALEVYAPDRTRVDQDNPRIPADDIAALEVDLRPLSQGTYTVAWRVLSIDSHVVKGTFAFAVGTSTATSATLDIPTRGAPFELDSRFVGRLPAVVRAGGQPRLPAAGFLACLRRRQDRRCRDFAAYGTNDRQIGVGGFARAVRGELRRAVDTGGECERCYAWRGIRRAMLSRGCCWARNMACSGLPAWAVC